MAYYLNLTSLLIAVVMALTAMALSFGRDRRHDSALYTIASATWFCAYYLGQLVAR